MICTVSHLSFLDIVETMRPCRYIVQEKFALVSNCPEFSVPKIIVQSRAMYRPDGTDYPNASFRPFN